MGTQLIFLGAPGSGKGTQAEILKKQDHFVHVSTGDLLRNEIKKASALGKKVEGILASGQLVDDHTVLELLKANCDLDSKNYIFDGFPRNLDQAQLLESELIKGRDVLGIFFEINPDLLIARLTNRRTCKDCGAIYNLNSKPPKTDGVCDECGSGNLYQRDDDKEEVIRKRLEVYNEAISPVLDYYQGKGCLKRIDASEEADQVYSKLEKLIG